MANVRYIHIGKTRAATRPLCGTIVNTVGPSPELVRDESLSTCRACLIIRATEASIARLRELRPAGRRKR